MGKTEIILILSIITAVIFIFIAGTILFVNQYRNRLALNEQEKAEASRQHKLDLLHNQLKVQQQTMQFIGSEIHDSVAQKLTLATLYSRKLEFEHTDLKIAETQKNISNIISDSLEELKDLSRTLSHDNIEDKELGELIKTECRRINASGVCRAESIIDYNQPLPFMVKRSVLRVIQEFIQNSLKHSGCDLIRISISEKYDGLSVLLGDNGKGFDPDAPASKGIGISNMKRRIKLTGGEFNMSSGAGSGTTLEFVIDHKNLFA